jgi:hypothetical protein
MQEIDKLCSMCKDLDFDESEAIEIIRKVDINEPFPGFLQTPTIFLDVAVEEFNERMVKLLLENGASPNLIIDDGNVFWRMQWREYPIDELYGLTDKELEENPEKKALVEKYDGIRLNMAKMMLDYGANPIMDIDVNIGGGEDLFSYVGFKVFNEFNEYLEYVLRFFLMLVAYGGCSRIKPRIYVPFDKDNLQNYYCRYKEHDGGLLSLVIYDMDDNIVAEV